MPKLIQFNGAVYRLAAVVPTINETEVGRYVYHVTKKSALPNVRKVGLRPASPVDMNDASAVYFFATRADVEEAVMGWLGERFEEEEELILLTVATDGLDLRSSSAGFEVLSLVTVPPENIVHVEDI